MLPQAFIDLAEQLIANEKNPEGFRSAISRAYYGAFLQAEDLLRRMNVFLVTDKKHQELLQILADTGDADVDEASAIASIGSAAAIHPVGGTRRRRIGSGQ